MTKNYVPLDTHVHQIFQVAENLGTVSRLAEQVVKGENSTIITSGDTAHNFSDTDSKNEEGSEQAL